MAPHSEVRQIQKMIEAMSREALSHKAPLHQHIPTWAPSTALHVPPTPPPTSAGVTSQPSRVPLTISERSFTNLC